MPIALYVVIVNIMKIVGSILFILFGNVQLLREVCEWGLVDVSGKGIFRHKFTTSLT